VCMYVCVYVCMCVLLSSQTNAGFVDMLISN